MPVDYQENASDVRVGPVNILIVDDLPEKHVIYNSILEDLGQNLVFANSGEEALKQLLLHEFAVILLDVNMPGMDGFETASFIRRRKKSMRTPIIFLTAFTDEMHTAQGYASGAVDYLATPVVPAILKAKVRIFIDLFQMSRQAAFQAEEQARRIAAEESVARFEFLIKVSESMVRAQSPQEVLNMLLDMPIPSVADAVITLLHKDATEPERILWAWKGADKKNGTQPPQALFAGLPWLEKTLNDAAASGQYSLLNDLPPPVPAVDQLALFQLPDLHSVLVLPLIIRNRTYGIVVLARERLSPAYQNADLPLGRSLITRASVALENAMLIEKIKEADQRKDEFLATLAHELRNPLAPISNALQIMQIVDSPDTRITELRKIMQGQVQHMSRLVDDLLDISRITKGKIKLKKESIYLSEVMESAVESTRALIEQAGHTLTLSFPPEPIPLLGDATRLSQVFSNLINNAAKYTDPGGKIFITAELDRGSVCVHVRDTGIGIPRQMLPRIFEMFTQVDTSIERSRGGLGIGLKLVKELCTLHGGSVTVASEGEGKGSEFTVRLPLAKTAANTPANTQESPVKKKSWRILVVDDNKDSAMTFICLLELLGHEAQLALDGPSALELAGTYMPQVVLLDIGLPGMDGYEVCRRMRADKKFRDTVFIAQTGWGQAEHRKRSREAGFAHHLVKPVDMETLKQLLQEIDVPAQRVGVKTPCR